MRNPLALTVGVGLAAAMIAGAAPAIADPAPGTTVHDQTATLRVVVRDAVDEHDKLVEQPVAYLEIGGSRYRVDDDRLMHVAPNSTLRVDATISGDQLDLDKITTVAGPSAGREIGAPDATGTRVRDGLVILAYWTQPDSKYTQASAQAEVADDDAWYREVSYGAEGISATATPWVRIPDPGAGCDQYAVVDSARAAAAAIGYDFTQYDRTLVYFPQASCPWAGVSQIGGDWSVFNGSLSTSMTTHEQGHELGLYHAHSYLCTGSDGYVPMGDWCDGSDYGDPFDTMGKGGAVHYNGAEKDVIGWLGDGRRVDLTPGSSTTLAPLEQQAAAPQVAKLQVTDSRAYYVEYRQLMGVDRALGWDGASTHGTDGVIIHALDPYRSGWDQGSLLLDMSPDANFSEVTLKAGQSWTTPEGWTIAVGDVTPSGAAVAVTAAAAEPPSAPRWPSATAGDASAAVSWVPPIDDGGSPVLSYTVTASPGGRTATVPASSWDATVDGLTNGTPYTFTVTATNSAGTSVPSDPTDVVVPQGAAQSTTYEETGLGLGGWVVATDAGATDGSYRSATAAGESSSYAFSGTGVTVLARGGPAAGKAKITVDGDAKGTVDLYRSTATAITLPFTGLSNGPHTVVIKATGTKRKGSAGTAVGVDGFRVGATTIADSAAGIAYSGWSGGSSGAASGGTFRSSATKNATVTFGFTGSAVTWVTALGPAYGKAQVVVDGVARGTYDQYAATASWQATRELTGLGSGRHTITIKVLGTKSKPSTGTAVVVDALVVTA